VEKPLAIPMILVLLLTIAIIPIQQADALTLGAKKNLSNNGGQSAGPEIDMDGTNLCVTWSDYTPGNADVLLRCSADGGATFGVKKNLSNNGGSSLGPQIDMDGTIVCVTWRDLTPGNPDVFVRCSADGGATFGAVKNLSNNAGNSGSAPIAIVGTNLCVTWHDTTPGNTEIFLRCATSPP